MNLDEAKQEIARLTLVAEGWRTIGGALASVAFGMDLRFEDAPPLELIEGLRDEPAQIDKVTGDILGAARVVDSALVARTQAALVGRAYRFFADGDDASRAHTECAYPLCPNRLTERPMTEVTWSQPDKLTTKARVCASVGVASGERSPTDECLRWAEWVACCVAAGRAKLEP
jgi:hypothetical protein